MQLENDQENILQTYYYNIESLLKDLYENKIELPELFNDINISKSLSFIKIQETKADDVLMEFSRFITNNLPYNKKRSIDPSFDNIKKFYQKLVEKVDDSYKQLLELIGCLSFGKNGFNCELKNVPKTNKQIIEYYLINKVQSFIRSNYLNNNTKIQEFIKFNHLIFCTDDPFQKICLKFFLTINKFISEKYDKFSNYDTFILNFYNLYYKYTKMENLNEFKEIILSKIDPKHFSNFQLDKKTVNEKYIAALIKELEILKKSKKNFKLNIDENLLNNPVLLKLFNLKKVDKKKIEKFFKFSTVKDNYLKFSQDMSQKFDSSVDDLNYKSDTLHIFNISFLIACGLVDKIERNSLQIFNDNNNVISLLKKYGDALLETINEIIKNIQKKVSIPKNEEIFGFGKIFKTFYAIYTNLNNDIYRQIKLKFDLEDNKVIPNNEKTHIIRININMGSSDKNSNFTNISNSSSKAGDIKDKYHEKLKSYSLEEACKQYIMSKIDDVIEENICQIEMIEMFKILFSLNFFIPYIDENDSLAFYPIAKQLSGTNYNNNNNINQYGYQEIDYMFKVSSNTNIPLNNNEAKQDLPFIKSIQIKINCTDIKNPVIKLEEMTEFSIKKDSLVIIENKNKFPNSKELFIQYITLMIKKLSFVINLIKNTSDDYKKINHFQLLLIYDDIVFNSDKIKKNIEIDEINEILKDISFNEKIYFTIEIVYVSQIVHFYNIHNDLKIRKKMTNLIKQMKNEMDEMKKEMASMKNMILKLQNENKKNNKE